MVSALVAPPEISVDTTRRRFLAMIAAAGLLTACGEDEKAADGPTRPVTHVKGTTDVPVAPQRIAALDFSLAFGLIELGMMPAGAPDALDERLALVEDLLPTDFELPRCRRSASTR